MSLAAPWALVGLLAIPILLWLDRRRRRAVPIEVPSLLFFAAADDVDTAARRPRPDADLWLALAVASLLALGAADPTTTSGSSGRSVRVVVDVGPAMAARSSDGTSAASRAEAVVDAIRSATRPDDDFARIDAQDASLAPAVRAGSASLRVLLTDRARPDVEGDGGDRVIVVAVGDPAIADAGIASVSVETALANGSANGSSSEGVRHVFVNVRNDGPAEKRLALRVEGGGETTIAVPAFGAASATLNAPGPKDGSLAPPIVVRLNDPEGALANGDEVSIDSAALALAIAPEMPAAYAALLRATLAVVTPGFVEAAPERAALWFLPSASDEPTGSRAALRVVLHPIAPGAPAVAATTRGPYETPAPDFGRDLDPAGCEFRYAASAFHGGPASAPWPIARRLGPRAVEWLPDPLAGTPAPADHPIWPLFVENVVASAAGAAAREGAGGYRVRGLLNPSAMTLGRDRVPWDPQSLARAPLSRRPVKRSLRPVLLGLGIAAALALWSRRTIARLAARAAPAGTATR